MILRFVARSLWKISSFLTRKVVIPVAITAILAALLSAATKKVEEDGVEPTIRPEP